MLGKTTFRYNEVPLCTFCLFCNRHQFVILIIFTFSIYFPYRFQLSIGLGFIIMLRCRNLHFICVGDGRATQTFPIFIFKWERIRKEGRKALLVRQQLIKELRKHPMNGRLEKLFSLMLFPSWIAFLDVVESTSSFFSSFIRRTQESHEKLVKVKFSGLKPISTFHSELEMKIGQKFTHPKVFFTRHLSVPSMQFSDAEIYLLSGAAHFSSLLPLPRSAFVSFSFTSNLAVQLSA